MKQDFTFSKFVLSELNYTDNEIKQIIETLQRGDFAYVGKKSTRQFGIMIFGGKIMFQV